MLLVSFCQIKTLLILQSAVDFADQLEQFEGYKITENDMSAQMYY